MAEHVRVLFVGNKDSTCGCYLRHARNKEYVCGRPATWSLVYGGLSLPICDRCARQFATVASGPAPKAKQLGAHEEQR